MLRYLKKKVHGLARSPNFENGIAPPLGVLGRKFFVVLNNSLGGTSGPSMSKIGDVRVPNHFDPCWNCPKQSITGQGPAGIEMKEPVGIKDIARRFKQKGPVGIS